MVLNGAEAAPPSLLVEPVNTFDAAAGRPSAPCKLDADSSGDTSDTSDRLGSGPGLLLVDGIASEPFSATCCCCCCSSVRFARVGTIESLTAMGSCPLRGDSGTGRGFCDPSLLVPAPSDMLILLSLAFSYAL